jgi:hypothetical protein
MALRQTSFPNLASDFAFVVRISCWTDGASTFGLPGDAGSTKGEVRMIMRHLLLAGLAVGGACYASSHASA